MKNIIVTGSSNGFGLKAAKDFADKGNKVFATMRNPDGSGHGCYKRSIREGSNGQYPCRSWED